MCYSADLSVSSFLVGIISSTTLIMFGNSESNNTNIAIGYFFIFVSFMQFIEFLLWKDIKCKTGFNKFGALIGPLFNHLQPVIYLQLANMYIQNSKLVPTDMIVVINVLYLLYVVYKYTKYIGNPKNLCVKTNKCEHLDWSWKKDFKYELYFIISFLNFINFYKNTNASVSFIISYVLLVISLLKFNQNVGEFWCLMVTGIPFINLFMQRILNINN
jgi:hypothetical protein